jgi:hypothetical protein
VAKARSCGVQRLVRARSWLQVRIGEDEMSTAWSVQAIDGARLFPSG